MNSKPTQSAQYRTVTGENLPDRDYPYEGILSEPRIGERWVMRLCAGLSGIIGIAFIILALVQAHRAHHIGVILDAALITIIAVPSALVAAYLVAFGVKGRIE